MKGQKHITFFAKLPDKEALNIIGFYKEDVSILKSYFPNLKIATKWREINFLKTDVIFVWWWTYATYPLVIGKLLGKKIIITGTFNYDKNKERKKGYFSRPKWQQQLIKLNVLLANKNLFVSSREFNDLKKDWKLRNAVYSPHVVDCNKYSYSNQRDSNTLLTICQLSKKNLIRKKIYMILDALESLNNDLKLIIAGRKDDGYNDLVSYIDSKKLNNRVIIKLNIPEEEKIELLKKCTIYLQPSEYEGFGLAIAEAMSCGSSVISSNVGEVPNVLGNTGVLLNKNTASELVKEIESLIKNKEHRILLGNLASEKITNEFSLERRRVDIINSINS